MEIIEYFEEGENINWITQIEQCDWNPAKLLAKLLKDPMKFDEVLGGPGKLFILKERNLLISFATLTRQECIQSNELYPWIGFVYTIPQCRGNKYSKIVIDQACQVVKSQGYEKVYVATEHAEEVYKKYGFMTLKPMKDVFGVDNQILYKEIK